MFQTGKDSHILVFSLAIIIFAGIDKFTKLLSQSNSFITDIIDFTFLR